MSALRPSDELADRAREVLERERRRIVRITEGDLVLSGGASVPAALTFGDIDLHLRVPAAEFGRVVEALREVYVVVHPEIWTATLATFSVMGEKVGIAVTPIGSEHDRRFTDAWRTIRDDPALLDEYNAMKRRHRSADDPAYLVEKSAFFNRVVAGRRAGPPR